MSRTMTVSVAVSPEIAKLMEHWCVGKLHKTDLVMYTDLLKKIQDKLIEEMEEEFPNFKHETFNQLTLTKMLRRDLEVFLNEDVISEE